MSGGDSLHTFRIVPPVEPKPNDPRLTPGAVFVVSGVVLLAIGAVA